MGTQDKQTEAQSGGAGPQIPAGTRSGSVLDDDLLKVAQLRLQLLGQR